MNMNKKTMKHLQTGAIALLQAYLLICILAYVFQNRLLYHPYLVSGESISKKMPGIGELSLSTDEGAVKVLTIHPHQKNAIIYFGGNAEDVSFAALELMNQFPYHTLYLMQYRGFGSSAGSPNEAALVSDAQALFDKIKPGHQEVSLIGRSLGSGVAIQLAASRTIKRVALITPYDSILNVAREKYSVLPVSLLLKDTYRSTDFTPDFKSVTLILAADRDQIISTPRTQALFESFPPKKAVLRTLANTNHSSISNHPDYLPLLRLFLDQDHQKAPKPKAIPPTATPIAGARR